MNCVALMRVMAAVALVGCADGRQSASVLRDTATASAAQGTNVDSPIQHTPTNTPPVILFLGTSLTAGLGLDPSVAFPQQIQGKIDAAKLNYRTVNAGVSGETSADLLRRLKWVLQQKAAVIVVETGANDGLRGLPVAGTRSTIDSVLSRIAAAQPQARVILAQMEAPPNLGITYTTAFREMFPSLAAAHGATLMPFLLDGVAARRELNQADGVHPNLAGERIVAENVWRTLKTVLGTP